VSTHIYDERITPSSGNVFRDLGRPDADLLLLKARLAAHIAEVITRRGWNQTEAAERLGFDQPRVSHLLRGRLSQFSIDALLGYLKRLDVKMQFELEDPPVGEVSGGKVLVSV